MQRHATLVVPDLEGFPPLAYKELIRFVQLRAGCSHVQRKLPIAVLNSDGFGSAFVKNTNDPRRGVVSSHRPVQGQPTPDVRDEDRSGRLIGEALHHLDGAIFCVARRDQLPRDIHEAPAKRHVEGQPSSRVSLVDGVGIQLDKIPDRSRARTVPGGREVQRKLPVDASGSDRFLPLVHQKTQDIPWRVQHRGVVQR